MLFILLSLIFIRPFISSLAYPQANSIYSLWLFGFLCIWIISKKPDFNKIAPLKYPLIIFIFSLFVSCIFTQDKVASVKELYAYLNCLLLFLIVISLDKKNKPRIIFCIVTAGLLISLLAIYQYFYSFRHTLNYMAKEKIQDIFALDYIMQKRAFFPFVTPNTLAEYLAMILMLVLGFWHKILLGALVFFAILLTKSIGALFSIFLILLVYLFLKKLTNKKYFLITTGFLFVVLIIIVARITTQKEQFQPIFSLAMRLNYWGETLKIITQYPLTGIGLGNFNLPDSRYAHNSYLQIWAEMGILSLISFTWLVISVFRHSLKNPALQAAVCVFLVNNLVNFGFFLPEVSLIWWVILGCLYSCHL